VPAALAGLPALPEGTPHEHLITAQVAHVDGIGDEFARGVASLRPEGDAIGLIDQLALGGVRAYLRNAAAGNPVALIHAVTCPLALELLLPWLPAEDHHAALAYAWQAVASIHVAFAIDRHVPEVGSEGLPSPEELIDGAIGSGDEHAMKLTEAVLRSYARTGEPVLLWAAMDASNRLRG
jgi:hypothetical protein